MKLSMRWAVVAVAICSWIAISNHCAFAAIAGRGAGFQPASEHRQEADATECPFHSKSPKQKDQSSHVERCTILRAAVSAHSNAGAHDDTDFRVIDVPAET